MYFGLTEPELQFLASHVRLTDVVFEFGTGMTTSFLASRCKQLTAVEHIPTLAAQAVLCAYHSGQRNVSVLSVPPGMPYQDGGEDDGDLATFREYVQSYSGRGVDVVLLDGRARCAAALWIAERAPFGPHPGLKVFLHDVDRPQLEPIWKDQVVPGEDGPLTVRAIFKEEERVGRLALLRAWL